MDNRPCKHCGRPEDEHCIYSPVLVPPGCVCDVKTWDRTIDIPPVCEAYQGDGTEYCRRCEHDRACHKS